MTTPVHDAIAKVLEQSIDQLRTAVVRLPDDAMDWNPLPGGNPVGVLVMHALTATEFWLGLGCGRQRTFEDYRSESRRPSFATRGRTRDQLLEELERTRQRGLELLSAGKDQHLGVTVHEPDGPDYSGAECLVRAVAHLREHVGHVETMSDFWGAGLGR
jgi:hypothetical protein